MTYIMTTPNLDATQHWWIESLARFMFSTEYQKGHDNAAADALSWVTLKVDAETIKSIQNGVIVGTMDRADTHDLVVTKDGWRNTQSCPVTVTLAWATCIDLHVADWVATQQEDTIFKTMIEWISGWKVQDLKHLLGGETDMEQGKTILQEWKKVTFHQRALYHHHTPAGELDSWSPRVTKWLSWMDVTDMLGTRTNNGHCVCYRASSGGQEWLLKCRRWSATVSNASIMKALMPKPQCHPSLLLYHWSCYTLTFSSIEMMMELDQPPNVVNGLVFFDHFMKHVMTYMTLDQTVKTVAKFLWQGYISIFRALVRLLSDWGANFENHIIRDLCELMGIRKVRTLPYHAQTNGQVEQAHQMLMHLIGKLERDKKADWPKH